MFWLVQEKIISDIFAGQHFANFKLKNEFFSTQIQVSSKWDGKAVLFGGTPEGFSRFLGLKLNPFSNLRAALRARALALAPGVQP